MLPQVVVAPRSTVAAHNVNFPIGVSQLDQQIVKKIKLLHVVVLYITGAVVAKKMVQLRDAIWKILIADAVDHIDMFTGMKVVETQPVGRQIGAQSDRRAREHTQQTEADK
jgi:tartrate dehydratase beta subunit/fumarate hydratase class I family protein